MGNLASLKFDASKVEPNSGSDPLPAGTYTVAVESAVVKPTKDNTGSYILVTYQVIDGTHKSRKVFDRITLENANADAVSIGRRDLSSLGRATGVLTPQDSGDFVGKCLSITVKVKPAEGQWQASNVVTKRAPVGTTKTAAASDDQVPF